MLPKRVRDELHLSPGDTLDLEVQGEEVTLRLRRSASSLQKERGIWVFRTGKPLSAAETEETLRKIRTQRQRSARGREPSEGVPRHLRTGGDVLR